MAELQIVKPSHKRVDRKKGPRANRPVMFLDAQFFDSHVTVMTSAKKKSTFKIGHSGKKNPKF